MSRVVTGHRDLRVRDAAGALAVGQQRYSSGPDGVSAALISLHAVRKT